MRRTVPPPSLGPLTTRGSGGLRQPSTTGGHGGGGSGGRLSHTRLQQLLVVLLLLSVTAVAWMVHAHHWAPNLPAIHVPHATFHHHQTAAAGGAAAKAAKAGKATKAAVRQPQTLKTFRGNLEFPLWWHAPFIAQSGGYRNIGVVGGTMLLLVGLLLALEVVGVRTTARHGSYAWARGLMTTRPVCECVSGHCRRPTCACVCDTICLTTHRSRHRGTVHHRSTHINQGDGCGR